MLTHDDVRARGVANLVFFPVRGPRAVLIFLEPHGLGALDGLPLGDVMPLPREGDASSLNWRPRRVSSRSSTRAFLFTLHVSAQEEAYMSIYMSMYIYIDTDRKSVV